jgi:Protein kinase domain
MSSLDSSHLHLSSFSPTVYKDIPAGVSWDKKGNAIQEGKPISRLVLNNEHDSRFFIAAKRITSSNLLHKVTNFITKSKHIGVEESSKTRLVVNINSIAKRLHLKPAEIKSQLKALDSKSFLEFLGKRADSLVPILDKYSQITQNFVLNRTQWINQSNESNEIPSTPLGIQSKTLMKVITIFFNHSTDTLNVKKNEIPQKFQVIQINKERFYAYLDESNKLQLTMLKKSLSSGGYGEVSKVVSFDKNYRELALKESISSPNQLLTSLSQESLKHEMINIHLIHARGRVLGAQDKPLILANISGSTHVKANGEISQIEDKKMGLLMPLYSMDYRDFVETIKVFTTTEHLEGRLFEFYQFVSCLKHLQDIQMVHLDIKPENFLIRLSHNNRNEAHLIDFGGALQFNPDTFKTSLNMTMSGPYSPLSEIEKSHLLFNKNPKSFIKLQYQRDVFAMGCVFYIALTGCFPFQLEEDPNTKQSHPKLNTYNRDMLYVFPEKLRFMIEKMLDPEPEKRPFPREIFSAFDSYLQEDYPPIYQDIQQMIEDNGYLKPR